MRGRALVVALTLISLAACGNPRMPPRNPEIVEEGRAFAASRCARCHGVGRLDESPLEQAPPFRRLHERYPIEQLAEAFAEGIVVGHSDMPPFELTPREISALIAYLGSLEENGEPARARR